MITIRTAFPDDLPALRNIKERASWSNPEDRAFLGANPHQARSLEDGELWVAVTQGQIAGYAALLDGTAEIANLEGLFVEPKLMRRGIGAALVAHACACARDMGKSAVLVDANPNAFDFYRACGFGPIDAGGDPAKMVLKLG